MLNLNPGTVFGRFTVIEEAERHRRKSGASIRMMKCICSCGTEKTVRLCSLTSGATVSCGCFHRQMAKEKLSKLPITHGRSKTQVYAIWVAMRQRCTNPNRKDFPRYGGRGIKVCDRWQSFETFLSDMGERPQGMTLERIDNSGDYEPGNVKWATYTQQARNTRRNRLYTIGDETKCFAEWCETLGMSWSSVKKRLARGVDPFKAQRKRAKK